jgi:hypothetical protein
MLTHCYQELIFGLLTMPLSNISWFLGAYTAADEVG